MKIIKYIFVLLIFLFSFGFSVSRNSLIKECQAGLSELQKKWCEQEELKFQEFFAEKINCVDQKKRNIMQELVRDNTDDNKLEMLFQETVDLEIARGRGEIAYFKRVKKVIGNENFKKYIKAIGDAGDIHCQEIE